MQMIDAGGGDLCAALSLGRYEGALENRLRAASAAAAVCLAVLVFDPKTTVPPIITAIAPIIVTGSNLINPIARANSHIPPMATAIFEIRIILRHLSMSSVSSSILASRRSISVRGSPSDMRIFAI